MKKIVGSVMLFLAIVTNLPAQVPAATIPEFNFFKLNKSLFTNKNLIELNLGNNEINHDGIIGITSVLNWNNDTL